MAMASALGVGALFAACGGTDEPSPAATPPPPPPPAEQFTGELRVIGLGVDLIEPIRQLGERDLGFGLVFDVTDTVTLEQKVLTQPESFDVWSGYQHQYDKLWASDNFQPVDRSRITRWNQVSNIHRQGKLDLASTVCIFGDGDAPFRTLYVDPDRSGAWPSSKEAPPELQGEFIQWVGEDALATVGEEPPLTKGVPQNFNMDSVGYNGDVIQLEPTEISWGELFNEQWRGKVALVNEPGVDMQDAGNAAQALGLMEFGTLGNMTKQEIDGLTQIMIEFKKDGHFRAFWSTFDESVSLMSSGEVVIESMWSPAVALLVTLGINVRYAAPIEGFRGWASQQGIPAHVTDPMKLQAVYDYLNWWHSGEPGAIMMRQGYYNAVQEPSRAFVEPEEWDFWIEGQPAAKDLPGITGNVGDIKAGTIRDGGSFSDRSCRYSSWNSFFTETEHQVARWSEFLSA